MTTGDTEPVGRAGARPVTVSEGTSPTAPSGTSSTAAQPAAAVRGRAAAGQPRRPSRGSRWRAAFFVLALIGILGVTGWALLGSRLLVVRVISVTGTHLVSDDQVRAAADVPPGTPLIRVDPAQVAARVEAIRQVASAKVTKDWPDGLTIAVRERVAVVAVRVPGGYDRVDPDGVVVTGPIAQPASLPLLVTSVPGGRLRGDPGVAAVAQVLDALPSWLSMQVAKVAVREPSGAGGAQAAGLTPSVTLYLSGGQTVVWGDAANSVVKARELAILMHGQASYYDLSAPGTVVTR